MNSKNQPETLQEKIGAIANEPVATAINNLQTEYLAIGKRLRQHPINVHGTILNMLQSEFALRQEETKNAISEYQHQEQIRREKEAAEAQAKLEEEQTAIATANRPHLAMVGKEPIQ